MLRRIAEYLGLTIFIRLVAEYFTNIAEKLGEHALIGWTNDKIAEVFHIRSPTIEELVSLGVQWAPSAILAAVCLSGWIYAFRLKTPPNKVAPTSAKPEAFEPVAPIKLAPGQVADSQSGDNFDQSKNGLLLERIKNHTRNGGNLLSQLSTMGDSTAANRAALAAWLTEAHEISDQIGATNRYPRYHNQLEQTIGTDLQQGKLYAKAERVQNLLKQLADSIEARSRDQRGPGPW